MERERMNTHTSGAIGTSIPGPAGTSTPRTACGPTSTPTPTTPPRKRSRRRFEHASDSCAYCGRPVAGPGASLKPYLRDGYWWCGPGGLHEHIFKREGALTPEKQVANEEALRREKEQAEATRRAAQERERREEALRRELRTLGSEDGAQFIDL